MPKAIFMAGYTFADLDKVQTWLRANDAILVDIRAVAFSKIPGWTGTELSDTLGKYPDGHYLHLPAWGNANYADRTKPHEIIDFEAGWRVVDEIRQRQRVLLMCGCNRAYEADERPFCHRGTIADIIWRDNNEHVGELDLILRRQRPEEVCQHELDLRWPNNAI